MPIYPMIYDPGCIERLFNKIQSAETPEIIGNEFLKEAGFKREVDESLLMMLTSLGFIDDYNRPSEIWNKYREKDKASMVLGDAITVAYWKLFQENPEAYKMDESILMTFFKKESGGSDRNAAFMVLTFDVLCDLADFKFSENLEFHHQKRSQDILPSSASKNPGTTTISRQNERALKLRNRVTLSEKTRSIGMSVSEEKTGTEELPIRITLEINITPGSDPELRKLVKDILKKSE